MLCAVKPCATITQWGSYLQGDLHSGLYILVSRFKNPSFRVNKGFLF